MGEFVDQCEKEKPIKWGQKDLYPALIDMQVIALPGCGEIGNGNLYLYPCVVRLLQYAEYGAAFEDDWYGLVRHHHCRISLFYGGLCWLPVGCQAQFNALEINGNKDGIV